MRGTSAQGLALLDKPAGITSFQALGAVKRVAGTGRVGHTGTLDRFARGLMVALIGRFTRLAPLLSGLDKCYTARVRFGEETSTLDPEGEVVARAPAPHLDALLAALAGFVGEIDQVPPLYSAVHHEGERAYRLARRGETPELAARPVRILGLDLLSYEPPVAEIVVRCGAGTYVRSLARDVALACGSRATVVELVRTEVGPFRLDEAVAPAAFEPGCLVAAAAFVRRLPGVSVTRVDSADADRIAGGALPRETGLRVAAAAGEPARAATVAVLGPDDELVAVLARDAGGGLGFVAAFPAQPAASSPGRSAVRSD
jgi:tRNA pseudouridine55 synthase